MFILYVLEGCPYCNNSLALMKKYNIKHKAIIVQPEEKEKYKKLSKMNTFPQIFVKINKDKIIKIGGNSDLEECIKLSNNIHNSNVSIDAVYNTYKNIY